MADEVIAKTPHAEMTIHQLAELQPGMAGIMKEVGDRYTKSYYAAKGGNWKLAAYHLNMVRVAFKNAKVTRPKFTEDLNAFDSENLLPVLKAIQAEDWARFEEAFFKGVEKTDYYHDKTGHPYIRYVLPEDPTSNLFQGPPEKFKRASKG